MSKYLVTGGAGFIGSWVAKALLEQNDEVFIIDNLTTGYLENVPEGATFIKGDCQDQAIYNDLKNTRFEAILHIAAQSSGEISFDDPVYDLRTNAESTLRLIEFGLKTGCKRIVFASTMSVYGVKDPRPIAENEELKPVSFYGVGKIASEHYLRIYQGLGIEPTSLRLFNVYGPGQNLENLRQGMVSIYLAQMIRNNKIIVKGNLDRFRDFIYIDDVVSAFMLCLKDQRTIGKTLNVGTGVKTTVRKLLEIMLEMYGKKVPVEISGNTQGDIFGIYADIELFQKIAGFMPKIGLKQGLKKMFDWVINLERKVR